MSIEAVKRVSLHRAQNTSDDSEDADGGELSGASEETAGGGGRGGPRQEALEATETEVDSVEGFLESEYLLLESNSGVPLMSDYERFRLLERYEM